MRLYQGNRQTDRERANEQTNKIKNRKIDRQTDRQADRQTDRQAGRQTGRQTDRQTRIQTSTDLPHKASNEGVDIVVLLLHVALNVAGREGDLPESSAPHHLLQILSSNRTSELSALHRLHHLLCPYRYSLPNGLVYRITPEDMILEQLVMICPTVWPIE